MEEIGEVELDDKVDSEIGMGGDSGSVWLIKASNGRATLMRRPESLADRKPLDSLEQIRW